MIQTDICFSSITELARLLTEGEVSSSEIVAAFLERIENYNALSRAFIEVSAEAALAAAQQADATRGGDAPPLLGIPFSSKDLIDIAGVPTTGGSRAFADNMAARNAFLIDRMLEAGAISLGKNNLHAFAYGATGENRVYGTAVNGYDHSRQIGRASG